MADRSSAEIFGTLFRLLASDEPIDRDKLAAFLWAQTQKYDFCPYQMYCDDALRKFDLLRTNKEGQDVYFGDDGFDEAE